MEIEKESEWHRCREIIIWGNNKRKASPNKGCISDYTINNVLKTFSPAEITDSIISQASVVTAPCEHQQGKDVYSEKQKFDLKI